MIPSEILNPDSLVDVIRKCHLLDDSSVRLVERLVMHLSLDQYVGLLTELRSIYGSEVFDKAVKTVVEGGNE